ncbi:TPA: restriction endonuclease subunit S [Campylobacter upsaliensis]|nr:restriction endonuclease subunit S [Campylobacter upsaliensis]
MASIEERIEDRTKQQLKEFGISYYTKTESINSDIDSALAKYPSKSGGSGKNYPDIKLFLTTETRRKIPVMIEVKGTKGRLEKLKNGEIENINNRGEPHYDNINKYALNGAVHYANAILDYTHSYDEVIALGINGYEDASELKTQYAFYYLNRKNLSVPKKIGDFSDLSCFSKEHLESFITKLDSLSLSEKERENAIENLESDIESKLNALNQFLHDELLNINPNTRVALLVGMIMAAQGVKGKIAPLKVEELKCEQGANSNDGQIFLNKIKDFLCEKNLPQEKVAMVINDLESAFIHSKLHTPSSYTKNLLHTSDESPLKKTYQIVLDNILPLVKKLQTADIAGRLFNSITKWLEVPDNEKNDVVLTPRYVVDMMVSLAGVNKDSFVWDYATGSGAFLISAMNAMIKDANTLQSPKEIESKIAHIKAYQLLGIEKRSDIYLLGILNMILLDDGSANLLHKDSLKDFNGSYEQGDKKGQSFPADVFLLNPPYSASGKGFIFVERALRKMSKGRACVIIQENAGSGNGLPYTADILKHSTLLASIKMPSDLFAGKSSVQTAIYVFEVGKAHNVKQMVKFIDFSSDGYTRAARKKAKASTNLKDTDNAKARYEELINVVLYGSGYLHYYKDFYIEDTINLEGRDWTYSQHKKINTTPTLADFKKCVSEYLAWEVSNVLKNSCHTERSEVSKNTQADSINGGMEGNALSPRLVKLEKDFKQNGGLWREFKLGELFEVSSSKKIFHANQITIYNDEIPNSYPYVVRSTRNNGVRGYLCENKKYLNPANTLSFAQDTFSVFYQEKPYFTGNKVKVLTPKFKPFTKIHALFFASIYQKVLETFTWGVGSTEDDIKDIVISLPVLPTACHTDLERSEREVSQNIESKKDFSPTAQNDKNTKSNAEAVEMRKQGKAAVSLVNATQGYQIAFNYMESYIKELEAERIQELEAYLKVTGLNDYTLSQKEQEALKAFENLSTPKRERERVSGTPNEVPLKWESFKIGDLFEISTPKKKFNANAIKFNGKYPYVARGDSNNGIRGYIDEDEAFLNEANTISFGQDTATIFYQTSPYFTGDKIKIFTFKKGELDRYKANFLISVMKKAFANFSWGSSSFNVEILKNVCVLLPVLPTACHTEPLGEVSQVESKRDFSLATQTQNDKNVESSATQDYQIAFDFIESFIKAIQKECIKSVVLWQKREAEAYRACVKED